MGENRAREGGMTHAQLSHRVVELEEALIVRMQSPHVLEHDDLPSIERRKSNSLNFARSGKFVRRGGR